MTRILLKFDRERILAISVGVVYLWFGMLKFFPEVSPAEDLAKETIQFLTFAMLPKNLGFLLLAIIEVVIGLCLVFKVKPKLVILVAITHLVLTFVPLIFFSHLIFGNVPFSLTLVGQYVIKNIIVISALMLIYPTEQLLLNKENI